MEDGTRNNREAPAEMRAFFYIRKKPLPRPELNGG